LEFRGAKLQAPGEDPLSCRAERGNSERHARARDRRGAEHPRRGAAGPEAKPQSWQPSVALIARFFVRLRRKKCAPKTQHAVDYLFSNPAGRLTGAGPLG
jgi:hypothetical protein